MIRQLRELLMAELDHRVKNTLSAVINLAEQAVSGSESVAEFSGTFIGRIRSLARAHEALAGQKWSGVDLGELVHLTLSPFLDGGVGRVHYEGPKVQLSARSASAAAMTLHELATNAMKHGALTAAAGKLQVNWQQQNGDVLLTWQEKCRRPPGQPGGKGAGLRLIHGLVEHELGGMVRFKFHDEGLHCRLSFPLRRSPDFVAAPAIPPR